MTLWTRSIATTSTRTSPSTRPWPTSPPWSTKTSADCRQAGKCQGDAQKSRGACAGFFFGKKGEGRRKERREAEIQQSSTFFLPSGRLPLPQHFLQQLDAAAGGNAFAQGAAPAARAGQALVKAKHVASHGTQRRAARKLALHVGKIFLEHFLAAFQRRIAAEDAPVGLGQHPRVVV